jgi:hypothetical protein
MLLRMGDRRVSRVLRGDGLGTAENWGGSTDSRIIAISLTRRKVAVSR